MNEWIDELRLLSDDPTDLDVVGDECLLLRHGKEYAIRARREPGVGWVLKRTDVSEGKERRLFEFIQCELFELPRIAAQVQRVLRSKDAEYISAPVLIDGVRDEDGDASVRNHVRSGDPSNTLIIQISGPAGQGKTALIERAAVRQAAAYTPTEYPEPILLPVNLMGRYVGAIDDAIAGSLNNTFQCPVLTQRDIDYAIKQHYLSIALDGFDELAARIGTREAFLRLGELVDRLDGRGCIIISARATFFESQGINQQMREHLRPTLGRYEMLPCSLASWTDKQAITVFERAGSQQPRREFEEFRGAFGGIPEIVFNPFLLSQLVKPWVEGDHFEAVDGGDLQSRVGRVIDELLAREVKKWTVGEQVIASREEQEALLSILSAEMLRLGYLNLDEMIVYASAAAEAVAKDPSRPPMIAARLPTHSFLTGVGSGRYGFVHENFLYYFVARRVAELMRDGDLASLRRILSEREFAAEILDWIPHFLGCMGAISKTVHLANSLQTTSDVTIRVNASSILARLGLSGPKQIELRSPIFANQFVRGPFENVRIINGAFQACVIAPGAFQDCQLDGTEFVDVEVAVGSFSKSVANSPRIRSVMEHGRPSYSPIRCKQLITESGLSVADDVSADDRNSVKPEFVACVEAMIKDTDRRTESPVENIEEALGCGSEVLRIARETGVVRIGTRPARGGRKDFFRFAVDRSKVMGGSDTRTGISEIDEMWRRLGELGNRRSRP